MYMYLRIRVCMRVSMRVYVSVCMSVRQDLQHYNNSMQYKFAAHARGGGVLRDPSSSPPGGVGSTDLLVLLVAQLRVCSSYRGSAGYRRFLCNSTPPTRGAYTSCLQGGGSRKRYRSPCRSGEGGKKDVSPRMGYGYSNVYTYI